jgi:hypothetical protein
VAPRSSWRQDVSKFAKTLDRVLRGTADASIGFDELCGLLRHLGFAERVRGSHHIFTREGVVEILNIQPKGGQAKPYQVKQVRAVLVNYGLAGEPETDTPDGEGASAAGGENGE